MVASLDAPDAAMLAAQSRIVYRLPARRSVARKQNGGAKAPPLSVSQISVFSAR
jgi:hypothetical protein